MLSASPPRSHAVHPAHGQRTRTTHSNDRSPPPPEHAASGECSLADPDGRFEGIVLPPAPAVLTSSPARNQQLHDPGTSREQPLPGQRSTTQNLHATCCTVSPPRRPVNSALLSSQQSPRYSPRHSLDRPVPYSPTRDFMPTLTGDKNGEIKVEAKGGKLGSWFKGNSAPVNLRVPIEGSTEAHSTPPARPTMGFQKKSVGFSLFGSSSKVAAEEPQPFQTPVADELLSLDIHSALFPTGNPDPFSP